MVLRCHKYLKWYISLIKSRQNRRIDLKIKYENHHIFPISIFEKNNNTILLTPREHYIAHLLLYNIYKYRCGVNNIKTYKMAKAFCWMMTRDEIKLNSKRYEYCKKRASESMMGDNNPSRKPGAFSKEHREKISAKLKGEKHPFFNKHHNKETREKISNTLSGRKNGPPSQETRKKISEATKGRIINEKTRLAVIESNKKRKGTIYNMKNSLKGKKQNVIKCPYCGKIGGGNTMYRWHFDRCKFKDDKERIVN